MNNQKRGNEKEVGRNRRKKRGLINLKAPKKVQIKRSHKTRQEEGEEAGRDRNSVKESIDE